MMHTTHSDNPITKERRDRFLLRQSVIEMRARSVPALLDPGSFRELLGPFDRLESPWRRCKESCPSPMTASSSPPYPSPPPPPPQGSGVFGVRTTGLNRT